MLSGRYQSWFGFVKEKVAEDGIARLYRGFRITMIKDVLGFSAFFGLFEFTKIELLDLYRTLLTEGQRIRKQSKEEDNNNNNNNNNHNYKLTRVEVAQLRRKALYQKQQVTNPPIMDVNGEPITTDDLPKNSSSGNGNPFRAPMVLLPSLLLPPYLGQASCILLAGATAAFAYQAIDYPLEQLRNYVYTNLADAEFKLVKQKSRILKAAQSAGSPTTPITAEWRPYHHFWVGLKRHAKAKELSGLVIPKTFGQQCDICILDGGAWLFDLFLLLVPGLYFTKPLGNGLKAMTYPHYHPYKILDQLVVVMIN